MKCSKCKNEAIENRVLCVACQNKRDIRRKARFENNQCAYCTAPISAGGGRLCDGHKVARASRDKERVSERKSSDLCTSCGLSSTTVTCDNCRARRKQNGEERNSRGLCRQCDNPKLVDNTYCADCKQYQYDYTRKLRQQVLDRYGNACSCCGETTYEFLAIDHVNDDGNIDRANGIRGPSLIRKIIAENYPDKYQILCHNCNFAKQFSPGCPHKRKIG